MCTPSRYADWTLSTSWMDNLINKNFNRLSQSSNTIHAPLANDMKPRSNRPILVLRTRRESPSRYCASRRILHNALLVSTGQPPQRLGRAVHLTQIYTQNSTLNPPHNWRK